MTSGGWPVQSMTEACEVNPRLPKEHNLGEEDWVSFVPMAAVDEKEGRIADQQLRKFAEVRKGYTHFREGDVLFAKITPCMENGKAAIARKMESGVGFGSTEFHVLRPRAQVLPEWIYYFVRRQHFRMEAKRHFTGTAGQQRVPTSFIESARIPIPPLDEQRGIVDILSRADGIVHLRHEARKKATELIPALFLDMFGDPAANPKVWPTRPLGELVAFMSGGTPSKARKDFWTGDLPWVSPKDMKKVEIVDAIDHVSKSVLAETNIKLVPVGSLLIVVRGMILVHTVPVARSLAPITINQDMKALIPTSAVDARYLLWLMSVSQSHLLSMVSTAAHGTRKLDTERLKSLLIPLAPLDRQIAFAELAAQIQSVQSQQAAATQTAEATFKSLLAQVFCVS
jgi:type I restriction enzyme S subunit